MSDKPYRMLLVTGDGCDSCDAVYRSEAEAYAAVKTACDDLQPDYDTPVSPSEPIDGHGVIYTLTPELWVLYRYEVSEDSDDFTPPPTPEERKKTMTDIEFQKARITRASEQVKRACDRRDYDTAGAWVRQFAIEVKRLHPIDPVIL